MYLNNTEVPDEARRFLYRRGFAFLPHRVRVSPPSHWKKTRFWRGTLYHDPEVPCFLHRERGCSIVLIGMVFDAEAGTLDERKIAAELAQSHADRTAFLDHLDRLGGRFALLVLTRKNIEVFTDAMGSRSIFYSVNSGAFASHAEMVAQADRAGLRDFYIPFLTSPGYRMRDVKYLPGAITPYEGVLQLTPNTSLSLPGMEVRRYWPRRELVTGITPEQATDRLEQELTTLARYVASKGFRAAIGLTAGTDSRSIYAAFCRDDPYLFTWIRSKDGSHRTDDDTRFAQRAAAIYGNEHEIFQILGPLKLNEANSPLSYAFRRSTGYFRGIDSPWLHPLNERRAVVANGVFLRGFGGEVLRGFYQKMRRRITTVSPQKLAHTYDVNAGTGVTRRSFARFIRTAQFEPERFGGRDPNDMFYWEHRMGTWGSIAMSEADLVIPSLVGFNSRTLYDTFLGLPFEDRDSRIAFHKVIERLAPQLRDLSETAA